MSQLYRTLTGQSQRSQNSKDSKPALERSTTTNTQTGVLNHLNEQQQEKLVQFKEKLEKGGWWSPDGINGKPTHDDGTLLRYLRARKFDVQGAIGQFTDTEKWMKEQRIEELYEHFEVDFYERARLMYPQWTGRRDRRGIPVYVFEIKGLDSKAVTKYQKDSTSLKNNLPNHKNLTTPAKLLPLFALYHSLLNFILPLCSSLERPRPEVPVTNSTNIVDISGVGLAQFWNLKQHMQDASVLATAHYPETLDRIFIIGAPSFFPTVWGWIKRWFDPVTVSKIFILSKNEVKPTLLSFMDPKSFPKKYGGELDWSWGDLPDPDDEIRAALERDGNKGWVSGPCLWLENERVVVGSEKGKPRRADKEVAEKKPVVYAADYTEEPVHPEKRASVISGSSAKPAAAQSPGKAHQTTTGEPNAPSDKPQTASTGAAIAAVVGTETGNMKQPPTEAQVPDANKPQTPLPADISPENVRTSPVGDSQVHLPTPQAAPPATTAEYISPTPSKVEVARPTEPAVGPASAPAETKGMNGTAVVHAPATVHPPSHPEPGPISAHTVEIQRKIAEKLEGESIATIPATANGTLPHPEIVIASDGSKGLAMEAEKLGLHEANNLAARPQPERFVTAAEF